MIPSLNGLHLNFNQAKTSNHYYYHLFCGHYTGQPAFASTPDGQWRILFQQFCCPHALADGS